MKILLLQIGKTTESYLREGISLYQKRLTNYNSFEIITIPELKNTSAMSQEQQKIMEGKLILEKIEHGNFVVLLDEKGKEFSSVEFSDFLEKSRSSNIKSMIFVIGGPYGFSKPVYERSNSLISLSKLTFSHQMVRLIFMEQLYRAFSILRNEPYHH